MFKRKRENERVRSCNARFKRNQGKGGPSQNQAPVIICLNCGKNHGNTTSFHDKGVCVTCRKPGHF